MTTDGLLVVDKPSGCTSHDVVDRIRRLAATRRVGHGGTLDPMATGVLLIGVGRATRMLGHLALTDKEYEAAIRLGQATDSGDAEGTVVSASPAGRLTAPQVRAAASALTGEIQQVPPAVSAIKVGGKRAYRLAREGNVPELPARAVTVHSFVITATRAAGDVLDVDAMVRCSSGTYVRALARDLGAALGVGGHLTMLRRTRVGPYRVGAAHTLDELTAGLPLIPLARAASEAFPVRSLSEEETWSLSHGAALAASPRHDGAAGGPVAAIAPDGRLIALVSEEGGRARPLTVFVS